jgi:16S rRNA processing protein RimM
MLKDPYYRAGTILKTHGVQGELSASLHEPDLFADYPFEMLFINPGGGPVPFFITSWSFNLQKNTLIFRLEGIDSPADASAFVKQDILLPADALPKPKSKRFFIHEVIGFSLIDSEKGELGPIEEVLDLPMQQVFRVMKGPTEILIPAVAELILSIDRGTKTVRIQAPEGLIDLYLQAGSSEEVPEDGDVSPDDQD